MTTVLPASRSSVLRSSRPVRSVPLALQVEQILVERLRSAEFRPGDQLPPEHDLAHELGVSRATLRIAIDGLGRRGLVVGKRGIGNFVGEASRIGHSLTEAVDLGELIAASGAAPGIEFDHADIGVAPPEVAAALDLAADDEVYTGRKRFTADGRTIIFTIMSVPLRVLGADLARHAVDTPAITEPLFGFLDDVVGASVEYQVTSLRAVLGSEISYPGADLDAGVAALELDEVGYGRDNDAVWHSRNWYPPSDMRFELVRRRPHRLAPSPGHQDRSVL